MNQFCWERVAPHVDVSSRAFALESRTGLQHLLGSHLDWVANRSGGYGEARWQEWIFVVGYQVDPRLYVVKYRWKMRAVHHLDRDRR